MAQEAPTDSKAPPAIWLHIQEVYAAMESQAAKPFDTAVDTEAPYLRYEGFTSHLFQKLGIAVPNYGPVLDLLREMGCITQERRGGGPSPSVWRLWKKPAREDFERAHKTMPQVQIKVRREQHEEQRIIDILKMLGGLDVPKALADLQNQLNELRYDLEAHLGEDHANTTDMARDDSEAS